MYRPWTPKSIQKHPSPPQNLQDDDTFTTPEFDAGSQPTKVDAEFFQLFTVKFVCAVLMLGAAPPRLVQTT